MGLTAAMHQENAMMSPYTFIPISGDEVGSFVIVSLFYTERLYFLLTLATKLFLKMFDRSN